MYFLSFPPQEVSNGAEHKSKVVYFKITKKISASDENIFVSMPLFTIFAQELLYSKPMHFRNLDFEGANVEGGGSS